MPLLINRLFMLNEAQDSLSLLNNIFFTNNNGSVWKIIEKCLSVSCVNSIQSECHVTFTCRW